MLVIIIFPWLDKSRIHPLFTNLTWPGHFTLKMSHLHRIKDAEDLDRLAGVLRKHGGGVSKPEKNLQNTIFWLFTEASW